VAHVLVEEAVDVRGLEVAVLVGVHERGAVEDDQVFGHREFLPPAR
jgi:hypothetical protein